MSQSAVREVGEDLSLGSDSSKDTGGKSRKKHKDSPQGMYEEVDDSGRGGM